MESDGVSDSPEELTAQQGVQQNEQISKIQIENKTRNIQSKSKKGRVPEAPGLETEEDAPVIPGMLPSNIVNILTTREKQTFTSDSEEEVVNHKPANKKKQKTSGPETVLLKEIPPVQCLDNSMEFLKRSRIKVLRSNSVLKNANQALRLLTMPGNLLSKS